MPLTCAIMLPTRDRCADLRRTLEIVAKLKPPADEVLVTADACRDDTVDFIRREHPAVRLIVNERPLGSTASRDRMMRLAVSDLVLSLDDDSNPIESDAIARIRAIFTEHPRVAVASLPQRTDEFPESLTATDFGPVNFAGSYVNCACAFRRSAYCELGGHFGPFWNAYDEPDFAVRCASAGWQVRFDPAVTIRHYFSGVNRNHLRMHHLHARNEIWSVLMRCPMPQLFAVIAFRIVRQFAFAWKWSWRWILSEPRWWLACLAGAPAALKQRKPVPWKSYRAWMNLIRHPIAEESEWEAKFGPR